jgi:hypothetical protein
MPDQTRQYKNYRPECTGQRGQTGLVRKESKIIQDQGLVASRLKILQNNSKLAIKKQLFEVENLWPYCCKFREKAAKNCTVRKDGAFFVSNNIWRWALLTMG